MQFSTPRPCSSCFVWWSSNTSLLHSNRRCVLFCFYGRLSEIEGKSLVLLTSLRKPFLGLLYHIRWMFRTSEVRWIHRNLMLSIRSNSSASMKSGVCSILLDLLLSIRTSLVLLGFRTRLLSENDPVRLNLLPVASLIIVWQVIHYKWCHLQTTIFVEWILAIRIIDLQDYWYRSFNFYTDMKSTFWYNLKGHLNKIWHISTKALNQLTLHLVKKLSALPFIRDVLNSDAKQNSGMT